MNSFGTKIKKLRAAKGMKQDDLAKVIGVSKGTVSVWERDARFPEIDTIQCLADYFGVPLSFLLDDSSGLAIQPLIISAIDDMPDISSSNRNQVEPEIIDMISYLSPEKQATIKEVIRMAFLSEKVESPQESQV